MKDQRIDISPARLIKYLAAFLLCINTLLYALRELDRAFWVGDYTAYEGVSSALHSQAFLFFLLYLSIFSGLCYLAMSRVRLRVCGGSSYFGFCVVVVFSLLQIYFSMMYGVGVAGSAGEAPLASYILFAFSVDGLFYIYFLKERRFPRLAFVTTLFIASNIVRGWAGFIVILPIVAAIKVGYVRRKWLVVSGIVFALTMPFLYIIRDIFRGGYSAYDVLVESGYDGFDLYFNYMRSSFALTLSRFDLYSGYIGVSRIYNEKVASWMCFPWQENLAYKLYQALFDVAECKSLGSILPGELYGYFYGKSTSFLIGSGFFALPLDYSLLFLASNVIVLLIASVFVAAVIKRVEYINLFIVISFVLLLQGWMYQYIYYLSGFFVGWVVVRVRLGSSERAVF